MNILSINKNPSKNHLKKLELLKTSQETASKDIQFDDSQTLTFDHLLDNDATHNALSNISKLSVKFLFQKQEI